MTEPRRFLYQRPDTDARIRWMERGDRRDHWFIGLSVGAVCVVSVGAAVVAEFGIPMQAKLAASFREQASERHIERTLRPALERMTYAMKHPKIADDAFRESGDVASRHGFKLLAVLPELETYAPTRRLSEDFKAALSNVQRAIDPDRLTTYQKLTLIDELYAKGNLLDDRLSMIFEMTNRPSSISSQIAAFMHGAPPPRVREARDLLADFNQRYMTKRAIADAIRRYDGPGAQ